MLQTKDWVEQRGEGEIEGNRGQICDVLGTVVINDKLGDNYENI
jgi:hypothetical protein